MNQLSLLPTGYSFQDIQRVLAGLPENAPIVDLTKHFDLRQLHAQIFVGATGSGKSTLLRQLNVANYSPLPQTATNEPTYGVYDDNGQNDDATIIRTMVSMLKHSRTQKYYTPKYKPIIMLRNATWGRIQPNFPWLSKDLVSTFCFPLHSYAEMLRAAAVPEWLIEGYLGPSWVGELCDARGHLLPGVAWDATQELAHGTALTTAKYRAVAMAGLRMVRSSPTLMPYLKHLPLVIPDDVRHSLHSKRFQMKKSRIFSRLLTAMRGNPLPGNWSRNDFMRHAEHEGIVQLRPQGWYVFSNLHSAGYARQKWSLTMHAISAINPI